MDVVADGCVNDAGIVMLGTDQLRSIFEAAILSRMFEARIIRLAKEGFLSPLLHPGAGQEIGQLAALAALRDDDPLLYGHRGVAYLVGRGVSLAAILSDTAGREGGTNNGKGGIMHVVDRARGVYGQSGTLGGGFVIAAGIATALRKQRREQVVVHFFGDGTANRGTFHEALNWCAVRRLPALFICENNGWAVSVPTSVSTAVPDIATRAAGYGIPGCVVDGGDPEAVFAAVSTAAGRARAGDGPSLIELKSLRLLGHYATDPQDYRADRDQVSKGDPLLRLRQRLIAESLETEASLAAAESRLAGLIEAAVDTVKSSTPVNGSAAYADLYA